MHASVQSWTVYSTSCKVDKIGDPTSTYPPTSGPKWSTTENADAAVTHVGCGTVSHSNIKHRSCKTQHCFCKALGTSFSRRIFICLQCVESDVRKGWWQMLEIHVCCPLCWASWGGRPEPGAAAPGARPWRSRPAGMVRDGEFAHQTSQQDLSHKVRAVVM